MSVLTVFRSVMLYIVFGECVIVLSQLTDHLSDLSRQVPLQTLIFHPSPSDAHCLTPPHHSEGCLAEGVCGARDLRHSFDRT